LRPTQTKSLRGLILNQWLNVVVCLSYPATWGSINKRIAFQASQRVKRDPISKITNTHTTHMQRADGVSQVVE
jgi:hypothetical protein